MRRKGTVSPDNGSHAIFYQIKSLLCEGQLTVFKFVNIIVSEIFKNEFLNYFQDEAN